MQPPQKLSRGNPWKKNLANPSSTKRKSKPLEYEGDSSSESAIQERSPKRVKIQDKNIKRNDVGTRDHGAAESSKKTTAQNEIEMGSAQPASPGPSTDSGKSQNHLNSIIDSDTFEEEMYKLETKFTEDMVDERKRNREECARLREHVERLEAAHEKLEAELAKIKHVLRELAKIR